MVDDVDERADEPLGTKEKFWVSRTQDDHVWLFKFAREQGGRVLGEDWAEWVVHKIAQLLDVPTATVIPASASGRRGVLSRRVLDAQIGEELRHGNELLAEVDRQYDSSLEGNNPRYTLDLVKKALIGTGAPQELRRPSLSGYDVFCGYLLMDALVAGQDRHHANWAVIQLDVSRSLAPSFDHGNALGFAVTDKELRRLVAEPELRQRWLGRGKSRHFAHRPPLTDLAYEALSAASPAARRYWRVRLENFNPQQLTGILSSIPTNVMSEDARTLALMIVRENRRRLLNDYPH